MLLTGLFTAVAVLAMLFCARAAWLCAQNLAVMRANARVVARVTQFEAELADQRALCEQLLESHKRLRSREGMRELRQRRAAESDPGIDPLAWKREMRAKLALGKQKDS